MNGGNGNDDGSRTPGNDDDEPLRELEWLVAEPAAGFAERVRRRIERRELGGNVASLFWHAPAAILLEILAMVFELFVAVEPGGGTR